MNSASQGKLNDFGKNLVLGFQHLLAMYSGDVLVPLLIGNFLHFNAAQMTYLVSIDIFMCGIATLLQLRKTPLTGIGLPVVLGCAVQSVAPLESIGGKLGIAYMYGAIICAGIFVFLIAGLFAKMKKLFPPVVTGSLITIIGFTLVPVGFQNLGGGSAAAKSFGAPANLAIGFLTIVIILAINAFAKGFVKSIAILLGILIASFIAGAFGMVSLTPVAQASWFHLPQIFYFGVPKYNGSAIVTMMLVSLTTMIESTGVYFALSDVTGQKITEDDMKRGYRAEGIAAILGGIFNTFPYSTFSQNVGVLRMSGVKTRKPVYYAAFLLLALGLLPKAGRTGNRNSYAGSRWGHDRNVWHGRRTGNSDSAKSGSEQEQQSTGCLDVNWTGAWRNCLSTDFPASGNRSTDHSGQRGGRWQSGSRNLKSDL